MDHLADAVKQTYTECARASCHLCAQGYAVVPKGPGNFAHMSDLQPRHLPNIYFDQVCLASHIWALCAAYESIKYDQPLIIGVDHAKPDGQGLVIPVSSSGVLSEAVATAPQLKHAVIEWLFEVLAQSLFHWNGTADDGDRGRDNHALVITLWDDGSGQIGLAHANPENVNWQNLFEDPEKLADWLSEWMDHDVDPPPTSKNGVDDTTDVQFSAEIVRALSDSIRRKAGEVTIGDYFRDGPLAGASKFNVIMHAARLVEKLEADILPNYQGRDPLRRVGEWAIEHNRRLKEFNAALTHVKQSGKWPGDPDYPSYEPERQALLEAKEKLSQAITQYFEGKG